MRDFDPAGAQRQRELHHVGDMIDIGPMDHRIDGERQPEPDHLGRECAFACESAVVPRDVVGGRSFVVLDRDLHMIKPVRGECSKGLPGNADGGGDEIPVEAGFVGRRGNLARSRLAPGSPPDK